MHIDINDNTRLKTIQKVFSDYYPNLSLEFFLEHHDRYEESAEKDRIHPNKKLSEVKKTHLSTLLEIQPFYKVKDLEKEFEKKIGIAVQVMKKEKEKWEQSTGLDNLCLKDLNILGRNSSDEFIVTDYDESFDEEY